VSPADTVEHALEIVLKGEPVEVPFPETLKLESTKYVDETVILLSKKQKRNAWAVIGFKYRKMLLSAAGVCLIEMNGNIIF
jgi:hypothetical protein